MCEMRLLVFTSLISLSVFCSSNLVNAKTESKASLNLKSKFPYALITEDYGILTSDDLEINGCIAKPTPFYEDSISYPYWRCLPLNLCYLPVTVKMLMALILLKKLLCI